MPAIGGVIHKPQVWSSRQAPRRCHFNTMATWHPTLEPAAIEFEPRARTAALFHLSRVCAVSNRLASWSWRRSQALCGFQNKLNVDAFVMKSIINKRDIASICAALHLFPTGFALASETPTPPHTSAVARVQLMRGKSVIHTTPEVKTRSVHGGKQRRGDGCEIEIRPLRKNYTALLRVPRRVRTPTKAVIAEHPDNVRSAGANVLQDSSLEPTGDRYG